MRFFTLLYIFNVQKSDSNYSAPTRRVLFFTRISVSALAGAFLAPFMLGLYWRGVTTASVWACFVWGVGLTVVNMMLSNSLLNPIDCGAVAMVGGFIVVAVVSLFTKKMDTNTVDSIFKCYDK